MGKKLILTVEEDGVAHPFTLLSEGAVTPPPEPPDDGGVTPVGAGWVDVTSELDFTFKDNRVLQPNLGTGGTYKVEAQFDIKGTVLLHGEAHFGPGASFPMAGNPWWFMPLSARLKPCRRGVGSLRIYHNNKGGTPPYYYFTLQHNPKLETDGFLDADYPPGCWATDGSYWLFDITYRTA